MLIRLLLLIGVIVAVWLVYRRYFARPARAPVPRQSDAYQRMIACERCGLHVPAEEAISRAGVSYCCRDHLPE